MEVYVPAAGLKVGVAAGGGGGLLIVVEPPPPHPVKTTLKKAIAKKELRIISKLSSSNRLRRLLRSFGGRSLMLIEERFRGVAVRPKSACKIILLFVRTTKTEFRFHSLQSNDRYMS